MDLLRCEDLKPVLYKASGHKPPKKRVRVCVCVCVCVCVVCVLCVCLCVCLCEHVCESMSV